MTDGSRVGVGPTGCCVTIDRDVTERLMRIAVAIRTFCSVHYVAFSFLHALCSFSEKGFCLVFLWGVGGGFSYTHYTCVFISDLKNKKNEMCVYIYIFLFVVSVPNHVHPSDTF